jgi:hypothetical protein
MAIGRTKNAGIRLAFSAVEAGDELLSGAAENEQDYFRFLKLMPFYPPPTFDLPVFSVHILFQKFSFQDKKRRIVLFCIQTTT